jgi:hypothetical protein
MPDKILATTGPFFHGLLKKYADRPLGDILSVGSFEQGENWARDRRFALPRGGKYFAESPETLAQEVAARLRAVRAADEGLQDVQLVEDRVILKVVLKTPLRVVSVVEAVQAADCGTQFIGRFGVSAQATLNPNDYAPSHQVGRQIDPKEYAGIEFPSVRRNGGVNYLLYAPLDHVDMAASSEFSPQLMPIGAV